MKTNGPKIFAICGILMVTPSCGEVSPDDAQALDWTELADGSFFAEIEEPGVAHMAERCWPDNESFICIVVSENLEQERQRPRAVTISQREELRTEAPLTAGSPDGYSCKVDAPFHTFYETITRNGKNLESNSDKIGAMGKPRWTKEYIEKQLDYFWIESPGSFNCGLVLRETSIPYYRGDPTELSADDITRSKLWID